MRHMRTGAAKVAVVAPEDQIPELQADCTVQRRVATGLDRRPNKRD